MPADAQSVSLDHQIDQWRSYLRRRQAIHPVDIAELEDHLREQVTALTETGLSSDEAFLVAVKRMGDLDTLSREFAREHADRLWNQLVLPQDAGPAQARSRTDARVAFGLAIGAALAIQLPRLFGFSMDNHERFYLHNAVLLLLPFLVGYFAWKRQLPGRTVGGLMATALVSAVAMNSMPFVAQGATELLAILHLPIALWLLVGIAYAGGRWHEVAGRMDFVRFSGELFIYFVLIALGGGLFSAILINSFLAIGLKAESIVQTLVLPSGAAGALLVASWLVEAKQSVIENMAPVLTRLFTPLFTVLVLVFLGTLLWSGRGALIDRDVLLQFNLILLLVLALLLYTLSARDPQARPGLFDHVQLVLVASTLAADLFALWAIGGRITEFGLSPNRVAVLGMNLVLLVNLMGSAVQQLRFVRGRVAFARLEAWQTGYLPVYSAWAAAVVLVLPPLFRYG
ncbi:MAG: permease prefix domain 1-containing protein [Gemmatimonadaceae bacterium]